MDADKDFARVLASFRHVKCNFKKHQRAEQYIYESLSHLSKLIACHSYNLLVPKESKLLYNRVNMDIESLIGIESLFDIESLL